MDKNIVEENNHPSRYKDSSIECIDAMVASKGWYKTIIFCTTNIFKYNWRLGKKETSSIIGDMDKMHWYISKARELFKKALVWYYPKNEHHYGVICKVKVKMPVLVDSSLTVPKYEDKWVDGVLYTDGKGMYVRELNQFKSKFQYEGTDDTLNILK